MPFIALALVLSVVLYFVITGEPPDADLGGEDDEEPPGGAPPQPEPPEGGPGPGGVSGDLRDQAKKRAIQAVGRQRLGEDEDSEDEDSEDPEAPPTRRPAYPI